MCVRRVQHNTTSCGILPRINTEDRSAGEGGDMSKMTRRNVLKGATAVAAGAFTAHAIDPVKILAQARPGATAQGVKALVYDVFGTCVDWRNGVARDADRILKPL